MPGSGSTISTSVRTTSDGGAELAGLLVGGVGVELDQIFTGDVEQVRKLEVLVAQRDLLEVLDEVGQGVAVERSLADLLVEDVLEHIFECLDVCGFELCEGLVERGADVGLEVA